MNRVALLVGLGVLASGCSVSASDVGMVPRCPRSETVSDTLVLVAQAVPTAQLLPCVRALPAGWNVADVDVRSGRALYGLDSDRGEHHVLTITLTRRCSVHGATEVPSEVPGARRYERALRVTPGYSGERYYVYAGGCTIYRLRLGPSARAVSVNEAALAVGFVRRDAVRRSVGTTYEGRLELDPPAAGS